MFDFILFNAGRKNSGGVELIDVNSLPKRVFSSQSDVNKARGEVKRVKYFHFAKLGKSIQY